MPACRQAGFLHRHLPTSVPEAILAVYRDSAIVTIYHDSQLIATYRSRVLGSAKTHANPENSGTQTAINPNPLAVTSQV
jgi:hypothetical protein